MVRTNGATKQVGSSTRSSNLREASDMALLTLVINHDDAAWAEMMRRTLPQVRGAIYAILKRYAPVLSSDARADILQDFYVKLLENDMARLRVYNAARGKLSSWLNLIAYQTAIDHARKIADRPRLVDLDELDKRSHAVATSELLFPSDMGGYRAASCLDKPFREVSTAIGLKKHITARAMRRTFNDLCRMAEVRDVVTRSISGHLTEGMQRHYSTVAADEQRASLAKVVSLAGFKAALDRGTHQADRGMHSTDLDDQKADHVA